MKYIRIRIRIKFVDELTVLGIKIGSVVRIKDKRRPQAAGRSSSPPEAAERPDPRAAAAGSARSTRPAFVPTAGAADGVKATSASRSDCTLPGEESHLPGSPNPGRTSPPCLLFRPPLRRNGSYINRPPAATHQSSAATPECSSYTTVRHTTEQSHHQYIHFC